MNLHTDSRIVMTLDAGGTNFVFCAVQAENEILEPITLPARGDTLEEVLRTIIDGFKEVEGKLPVSPSAISFAFPGPSDYENGIIGDLQNLPQFRGGVALGPMLREQFGIPVFINNDGDLFSSGSRSAPASAGGSSAATACSSAITRPAVRSTGCATGPSSSLMPRRV
jgi:glucokinase